MPKGKNDPHMQPKLLAEPQAEYQLTPEELAEKEHYRQRLAEHLKDPVFRQIEGFPISEDEIIQALSDPPYYTACPNPFMGEIIERWQQERQALRKELGLPDNSRENGFQTYHREPFAVDVSEGKGDPIYNAHSYHTKVPHKAIMRYILHYTDPGDIVFDGFCGTGMTGVAVQLCGDKKTLESLGYTVQKDRMVLDEQGQVVSRLGRRKAVLVDLSPAATFIAYNYNSPVDGKTFEREAGRILREVEHECGWMYETWHPHCDDPNRVRGEIKHTVWSDVFICGHCGEEIIFWDAAVDKDKGQVMDVFTCKKCGIESSKRLLERVWETFYDRSTGKTIKRAKRLPVIINYSVGNKRYEKCPNSGDYAIIQKIDNQDNPYWKPTNFIGHGDKMSDPLNAGITHIHHFYTERNAWVLAALWKRINAANTCGLRFWFTSTLPWCGRENRLHLGNYFGKTGGVITSLRGTWYIASLSVEVNVLYRFKLRIQSAQYTGEFLESSVITSTQSATNISLLPDNSVDYIFVDPPFGENLMYSELNITWESWLQILTNKNKEAIINRSQKKTLFHYQALMEDSFVEFFRILKHGRWITIEFHNSKNSVWNSIQEAASRAGFIVADVRGLAKGKGSFNQVTATGAVKQDLIISAYKPTTIFERQFQAEAGSVQGAWTFIRQHLEQLPLPSVENSVVETLAERQAYLLYDRMVAFHLVRGLSVPLSSPEFYQGLAQRFLERDGMYFTPAQAAEYDKLRLKAERVEQLALFVTDEKSAVQWLRQALDPSLGGELQTYQDLQPKFIQQLHQARHEKLPELRQMLEENFLQDEAERWYNPNPDRKADLEALRQRTLLREYKEYLKGKGRLKIFRSEAVRAGFSADWKERNYADIVQIAERLPENVLQEDQGLLMYYHNASLRLSDQPKQAKLF